MWTNRISIKWLKRFVADYELEKRKGPEIKKGGQTDSEKVAVIGAGPAGLSCAYYLALKGYPVTIFERLGEPGGMAAVGIPDYRLPRDIVRYEAGIVERLGVEIRYNTQIGKDITLSQIFEQGYKAVFIGVGAQTNTPMGVEGEDKGYKGFIPGVFYLLEINLGRDPYPEGKKVVVVGGGNVAIDCVRSSFRIGKAGCEPGLSQDEERDACRPGGDPRCRGRGRKIPLPLQSGPDHCEGRKGGRSGMHPDGIG